MKYKCVLCTKSFETRREIRKHILYDDYHENKKLSMSLIDGMILATDIENNEVCEESFTRNNNYKKVI